MFCLLSILIIAIGGYNAQFVRIPLTPWLLSDWDASANDFAMGVPLSTRSYIYKSILPTNTSIYTSDPTTYRIPTFTTVWGGVRPTEHVANVGLPGPFDYKDDYTKWGGDEVNEFGKSRYSGILADFGHSHILAIHIQNEVMRANPNADRTNIDLSLERMAGGSSFIFGRFGGIIDYDGNFMNYAVDDAAYPMVVQLKDMMKMFIFGNGDTYDQPGSKLNLMALDAAMRGMANAFTTGDQNIRLMGIVDRLGASLYQQLQLGSSSPIPLVAWDPLMKKHQGHTSGGYAIYSELYGPNNNNLTARIMAADMMYRDGIIMGRQMGAFFTAFYGFTDFLDKFMLPPMTWPVDYAIPLVHHVARTQRVYSDQQRYWIEHTTMFEDYNKASARGDHQEIYRIRFTMLESCANIATTIGEIFRAFDTVIRSRNIYGLLRMM